MLSTNKTQVFRNVAMTTYVFLAKHLQVSKLSERKLKSINENIKSIIVKYHNRNI